jgi:hypothetical protein
MEDCGRTSGRTWDARHRGIAALASGYLARRAEADRIIPDFVNFGTFKGKSHG